MKRFFQPEVHQTKSACNYIFLGENRFPRFFPVLSHPLKRIDDFVGQVAAHSDAESAQPPVILWFISELGVLDLLRHQSQDDFLWIKAIISWVNLTTQGSYEA